MNLPPIPEGTPPGGHIPPTCLGTNLSASLGTDRASLYSGSEQLSWLFVIAIFIVVYYTMSWLRASAALRLEPGPATLSGEYVCVYIVSVSDGNLSLKTGPLYFFVECNSC